VRGFEPRLALAHFQGFNTNLVFKYISDVNHPDEIHYLPPVPSVYDILGGAGSFSALGARIFSPPPLSRTVSWIVDKGSDFPVSIATEIAAWDTSCIVRDDPSRLTTRGWNGYDEHQNRAFRYTTPKLRLDEHSLTPELLFSKSFHLICSPSRCTDLVRSILRRRKAINPGADKPIFIWEPVPDLMTPDELLNTTNALPYVDICSPNHKELAALMGDPDEGLDPATGEISAAAVERACEQLLGSMPLQTFALVIRCGEKGCFVAKNGGRSRRPSIAKRKRPANHASKSNLNISFSSFMNTNFDHHRRRPYTRHGHGVTIRRSYLRGRYNAIRARASSCRCGNRALAPSILYSRSPGTCDRSHWWWERVSRWPF